MTRLPRSTILRLTIFGFTLVVSLAMGAAYLGYRGSRSIHQNARELVREHLVQGGRGAELENLIESESQELLDELLIVLGLCTVLAFGCAAVTILTITRSFEKLEWQTQELQRVSWHMLETHERVARRFSHEMHDELGQALTGLKGLIKRLPAEQFAERRGECVEVLDGVLQNVRELSQLLRPVILDDFGLDAALRWLVDGFSERTGIRVGYRSNFTARLSDQLETQLFRITQEALTNIARHADARTASISLTVQQENLTLTIEDDGHGMPISKSLNHSSLGMVGMRARARQVGGDLRVENGVLGGLRLRVAAPVALATDAVDEENPRFIG
jgi:signal transduction histidine kinase